MAEFRYNEKESLVWECTNCIVIENGDVQEQTNQEGVIITKEKNYSLENIYNKQYDEKELNIKQVTDIIEKMGISDEEIEAMYAQLPEDGSMPEDGFEMGGAFAMPFFNSASEPSDAKSQEKNSKDAKKDKTKDNKIKLSKQDKINLIEELTKEMNEAAKNLDFERAMELRDALFELQSSS